MLFVSRHWPLCKCKCTYRLSVCMLLILLSSPNSNAGHALFFEKVIGPSSGLLPFSLLIIPSIRCRLLLCALKLVPILASFDQIAVATRSIPLLDSHPSCSFSVSYEATGANWQGGIWRIKIERKRRLLSNQANF